MRTARRHRVLAEALAAAFLDGEWSPGPMAERGSLAFGRPLPWLRATAGRIHRAFDTAPRDRLGEIAELIRADPGFDASWPDRRSPLRVRRFFLPEPAMAPAHPEWRLPQLAVMVRPRSAQKFFLKVVGPLIAFVEKNFRAQIIGLLEPDTGF